MPRTTSWSNSSSSSPQDIATPKRRLLFKGLDGCRGGGRLSTGRAAGQSRFRRASTAHFRRRAPNSRLDSYITPRPFTPHFQDPERGASIEIRGEVSMDGVITSFQSFFDFKL